MNIFKLPDLGEGLPDAEIHEWFVKEGDHVTTDQLLVSMETAKAVVEVPSPFDGVIEKCFGKPGDIIKTGDPLVGFEADKKIAADKGTVVGHLEESAEISDDEFTIGASPHGRIKITPANRLTAKRLNVDVNAIKGSGPDGYITREDIERTAQQKNQAPEGYEPLRGVRRAMLASMTQSHQEVVSVSIFDDADIQAWLPGTDITVRLIQALIKACQSEPALNAWYDGAHAARRCFDTINLGIAMDSEEGLFVPVIHQAECLDAYALREKINTYKQAVKNRNIAPEDLRGATITLSNFGKFAGKYANPIIVPPQTAILGVGRLYEQISTAGGTKTHRMLPLSLSFDHRAITGGEATRFLGVVMKALESE